MPKFTVEKHIAAPPENVFALASNFANAAANIKGIKKVEMLTPGPVGVGTRFKETRVMLGKEATETMEVTAFEPPRGYTLEAESCGAHYISQLAFVPEGGGTRLVMSFEAKAVSFLAKLMTPLSWLFSGMIKKCIEGDLNDLKARAETPP